MWLFGGRSWEKRNPNIPSGLDDSGDDSRSSEPFRFDSTALERAAQAAKELERSQFSKDILELTKLQEAVKMQEYQCKLKEYDVHVQQALIEQKQSDLENRLKALGEETKQQQMRYQYEDQLERKRFQEQLKRQQRAVEENLRKEEEMVRQQEELRRSTIAHETDLKHKNAIKKIQAEIEAIAKKERENQDLTMEEIRLKASEARTTILESLKTAGSVLGLGAEAFLKNWNMVLAAAGGITVMGLGLYTAKNATMLGAKYVEAHIVKPSLIMDTSRLTFADVIKHPITSFMKLRIKTKDPLKGVVLEPSLDERLRAIAVSTKYTKQHKGYHRNILLHGLPGTGKTMFAKKLANASGMDFAIMTGGDVAPMGRDGAAAIHKVFNWAETSKHGLLLFIDEADVFLRKRRSSSISEDLNSSLNAFLNRTGTQSSKFMLVVASNMPDSFDQAIMDRIDEMVEFPLPGYEERRRLVRQYFEEFVLKPAVEGTRRLKVDNFDYTKMCDDIAKEIDGFSGREISKLAVAWVADATRSEKGVLTEQMARRRVMMAIREHQWKDLWLSEEERIGSHISPLESTSDVSDESTSRVKEILTGAPTATTSTPSQTPPPTTTTTTVETSTSPPTTTKTDSKKKSSTHISSDKEVLEDKKEKDS